MNLNVRCAAPNKMFGHEGEVLRNLKKTDLSSSICCLLGFMSAYLAVSASGTTLFPLIYFLQELGQTLVLCLSQTTVILFTTY